MGSFENGFDLSTKEEVAGSKNRRISTRVYSLANICFADKALWNGMSSYCKKATCFSEILAVSFSLVQAIYTGFNITVLIDSLSTGNLPCHHNTMDIEDNNPHVHEFQRLVRLLLALGEFGDFQYTILLFLCHI